MEFLGTKESWSVYGPGHVGCTNVSIGDCNGFNGYIELWHHHYKNKEVAKANALLISKAPEMLEILIEIYAKYEKDGHLLNVSPSKIQQLIKEATELK